MEMLNAIGRRLHETRKSMGYSQGEFAKISAHAGGSGTSRQSQARYEKGIQSPGAVYIAAIALAGVDVVYILTGQQSGSVGMSPTPGSVSLDEKHALMTLFDKMTPEQRRAMIKAGKALLYPKVVSDDPAA